MGKSTAKINKKDRARTWNRKNDLQADKPKVPQKRTKKCQKNFLLENQKINGGQVEPKLLQKKLESLKKLKRCKVFAAAHRGDVDCQAYISASRRASSDIAKAKAEA